MFEKRRGAAMILYHGSNCEIEKIDLLKGKSYKDFGRGFYLTDLVDQATQMATRIAERYGGSPIVNVFEFDGSCLTSESGLRIKIFEKPSKEWAEFIMQNRSRSVPQPAHTFDIVIGPVANDDVATLFRTFTSHIIDLDELVKKLEFKKLTNQYFFHTEQAVALLKKRKSL